MTTGERTEEFVIDLVAAVIFLIGLAGLAYYFGWV
jgi:hypothetical protein